MCQSRCPVEKPTDTALSWEFLQQVTTAQSMLWWRCRCKGSPNARSFRGQGASCRRWLSGWIFFFKFYLFLSWAFLVDQSVKNLPAMQETWVQSLYGEDPLEQGMALHSSMLVWSISWTEQPGGLQSMGSKRVHK